MIKKFFAGALFCALLSAFNFETFAKAHYPRVNNERFAVRAMRTIHSAEVTYQATAGNGGFGSLNDLLQANLINTLTASGERNGYHFVVQTTARTGNIPASFFITATPQRYPKTGRKSFYLDTSGALRGADKNGAPATANDLLIENECLPNEECTIANLRTLHSAEVTYSATSGNGNYTTLNQLHIEGLINELLARGYASGYNFTVTFTARTNSNPATFSISAVPITYGVTGIRSFYIATDGVIYAADKQGAPATADDPPLECLPNEECTIANLRTLYSAEGTYQATSGNGNYTNFTQLFAVGLVNSRLATGSANGYNLAVIYVDRTSITPASFKITAVPINYGATGIRSFYVDESGVIRGADKNGAPADANDPPIGY